MSCSRPDLVDRDRNRDGFRVEIGGSPGCSGGFASAPALENPEFIVARLVCGSEVIETGKDDFNGV